MKKLLGLLVVLACFFGAVASSEALINGEAGDYPIVSEPYTLKIFAATTDTGMADPATGIFSLDFLEEHTGVNFDWEYVTGSKDQISQRTNLKFASNNLPDIFSADLTKSMQMQYGESGLIIPLNDLIEEHTVNLKKVFDEMPEVKAAFTAPDGNIYGLGRVSEFYQALR